MANHSIILYKVSRFIPSQELEALAQTHHRGQKLRKFIRCLQYLAFGLGQLLNCSYLRDILASLSVFLWSKFSSTKDAIKLHSGLDHYGDLPYFITITAGNVQDVTVA